MNELRPVPKPTRPERGTARAKRYMALVAQLPCVACGRYGVQLHHPIMGRFSQARASDLDVVPVCPPCHRELHASPEHWRRHYGADTDHIEPTRAAVERLEATTIGVPRRNPKD